MQAVTSILNTLLPVIYTLTVIDYCLYFFRQRGLVNQTPGILLRISVAAHLAEILARSIAHQHFPITNTFEAVSAIAFAIAAVYMTIEIFTGDHSTGFFIIGIVFLFQLISSALISSDRYIPEMLSNPMFIFHAIFAVIAYSAFAISAIYGLFYLMLYHEIKYHRFGILFKRLTSLDMLGRLNFAAAVAGFFCLSVSTILGFIWGSTDPATNFRIADPKVLTVLCSWAIYGACIAIRKFRRQQGNWFVYFTMIGFLLNLLSIAIGFIFTSFHRFG